MTRRANFSLRTAPARHSAPPDDPHSIAAQVPFVRGSRAVLRWFSVAMAAWLAGAAFAQDAAPPDAAGRAVADLTLEELIGLKVGTVYAASRYWQDVARAPSRVSILTGEEIKLYGHRNLAEALRSLPGLSVAYDRNYSYLNIGGFNRGDYNSHVLVLVNGHRLNDNLQDSALLGHDFIVDIDLVDRVEVIRGPGSSVYGNNAFLGVVNVITRTGRQLDGVEASADAGSFESYKARFSAGRKFENGIESLLSGSYHHSRGPENLFYKEYDAPASNHGIAHRVDGEEYYSAFSSTSWRDLTLEGGFNRREKEIPTGSYSTVFNSPRNRTTDTRAFADLKYERSLGGDWDVMTRLHGDYSRYDGDYLYEAASPPPDVTLNVDRFTGAHWGGEAQASRRVWDRHTLTVGSEFRRHFRQDQRNANIDPPAEFLDDRRESWTWGAYAQGEIELRTNLTFSAGLRYDHDSTHGDSVNPRLALVYAPAPATALKFIYGTAYRAPNPAELYYHDGNTTTKANPFLDPETITTYQAVWRQLLPGDFRIALCGFRYETKDLISYTTDPADGLLHFVNMDKVRATGGEVELEKNWSSGFRLRASYTYQDARDARTDEWLTRSPRHLAKLNFAAPLWTEKIFAGAEAQYSGPSRTLGGGDASGYWVLNATLFSQKLIKGVEFSAGIYNLLDEDYGHPAGSEHRQAVIQQDGRAFRVKLTYRF